MNTFVCDLVTLSQKLQLVILPYSKPKVVSCRNKQECRLKVTPEKKRYRLLVRMRAPGRPVSYSHNVFLSRQHRLPRHTILSITHYLNYTWNHTWLIRKQASIHTSISTLQCIQNNCKQTHPEKLFREMYGNVETVP